MNKKETKELTNDMLITDALLQLKTLQDLLIAKGVFTREEFIEAMDVIAKQVAKTVLANAKVQGDLDELISSLQKDPKSVKKDNN